MAGPEHWSLVDRVLERLSRLEGRNLRCGDLDILAGLGIATDSGGTLSYRKRAEAYEADILALGHLVLDGRLESLECFLGINLGQVGCSSDGFDQLGLVHVLLRGK